MKKILLLLITIAFLTGCKLEENEKVNIKKYESQLLELTDYSSTTLTARIPDGWKVEEKYDNNNILIRIYDPENESLQMFYLYKINKVSLKEPTIRSFVTYLDNYIDESYNLPSFTNIEIIEEFNTHSILEEQSIDDRTIRAKFNDKEAFISSTYMNIGMSYNMYNIFGIITPLNEYINYRPILTESLSSIKINPQIETTNEIEETIIKNINNIIKNIYASYNNSWTYHQKEYDTTIQKEYDNKNNYIRVYDSKTNNIYKAYDTFMKDYHGSRYKRVTDIQYSDAVYGYIYK